MIQPAGAIVECQAIARRLLAEGWRRERRCVPRKTLTPDTGILVDEWLNAVRLHPKDSEAYFLELIGFPAIGQTKPLLWAPCELDDGWYGLPCFRFMGLLAEGPRVSATGISYAANALFAVALDARGEPHQVRAFSVHPGAVMTELVRSISQEELDAIRARLAASPYAGATFYKSTEQGAATSVWCATSAQLDGQGGVYCEDVDIAEAVANDFPEPRGVRQWATDPTFAARLWKLSEECTGVTFAE